MRPSRGRNLYTTGAPTPDREGWTMKTTWHVRWETVAGWGSRAFRTLVEAQAWVDELARAGIPGAWVWAEVAE